MCFAERSLSRKRRPLQGREPLAFLANLAVCASNREGMPVEHRGRAQPNYKVQAKGSERYFLNLVQENAALWRDIATR